MSDGTDGTEQEKARDIGSLRMRAVNQDDLSDMDCEGIIGRKRYSKQDDLLVRTTKTDHFRMKSGTPPGRRGESEQDDSTDQGKIKDISGIENKGLS